MVTKNEHCKEKLVLKKKKGGGREDVSYSEAKLAVGSKTHSKEK